MKGHFWIEKPDGSIYDPDFPDYSYIKRTRNCTDEKVYYPVDIRDYPEIISTIFDDWKKMKQLGMSENFYTDPFPYMCNRNALAYKTKHPECKLMYGSFGWKTNDGEEWIEFDVDD